MFRKCGLLIPYPQCDYCKYVDITLYYNTLVIGIYCNDTYINVNADIVYLISLLILCDTLFNGLIANIY